MVGRCRPTIIYCRYLLSFHVAPSLVSFTSKPAAASASRIWSLQLQHHVDDLAESFLAGGVVAGGETVASSGFQS